jgi:uncharacterized protein (TIGR02001 family)
MKRSLSLLAAAACLMPGLTAAQAAGPLTGNLTLTSDYRFRGLSQSYRLPAVQGGIDWSHASGLYLGNWNSSVSGNQFPNGASLEMDFYGGYKMAVGDVTLDFGGLYYFYPGAFYNGFAGEPKLNNFELYVGAAIGPFSAKVFVAMTDFFGLDETVGGKGSSGSYYLDLNYATEIAPKLTLGAHLGYQKVRNYGDLDYVDYKVGLTYDWGGWALGAAYVGTNAEKALYTYSNASGSKFIGNSAVVFSIGKTF